MTDRQEVALIAGDGRPRFGLYPGPLTRLNPKDFRPYGKKKKTLLNRLFLPFRIKQWLFVGLCSPEFFFGLAVVRLGYLSQLFLYLYDRRERRLRKYEKISPGGGAATFKGTSREGEILFHRSRIFVGIRQTTEKVFLEGDIRGGPDLDLLWQKTAQPMICLTRVGLKGFNYTHKEAGLRVCGRLHWQGRIWEVEEETAFGVLDYTLGLPPRQTFWNWAAGGGKDRQGNRIGFNLVQGINETGFTENAFWINDRLVKTDTVDFSYDDLDLLKPWRIHSGDGRVRLRFLPEGKRSAHTQAIFLASRFHQPFGLFSGSLNDGTRDYALESVYGFTEEHWAKW